MPSFSTLSVRYNKYVLKLTLIIVFDYLYLVNRKMRYVASFVCVTGQQRLRNKRTAAGSG